MGRDLVVTGERIDIRGPVARNVHAWAEEVALLDGARIGGDVQAVLPRGDEVEVSSGAVVAGEISSRPFVHPHERGFSRYLEAGFWVWIAVHVGAAFLVGMLAHALLPGVFGGRLETSQPPNQPPAMDRAK